MMTHLSDSDRQIRRVLSFQDLVLTPFEGEVNAIGWIRELTGDFAEIVHKVKVNGNITEIGPEELASLQLSEQGQLARETIVKDYEALKAYGASPVLNVILNYDRDDGLPFFPTDVYSFHVDRSPIPTSTFLCTYYGEPSDILPNAQARQKVLIPEILQELKKLHHDQPDSFESFLTENFFDLHYQAEPDAHPISLGIGHLWRLAVDHPESKVLPCVHRAPVEKPGEPRLLMIC